MRTRFLTCLFCITPTFAEALEGIVLDPSGSPIAGATVEWQAGRESAITDSDGRFELDVSGRAELHIEAPRHAHRLLEVSGDASEPLTITLQRTVMEIIDVVGLPVHGSSIEAAQPITVLSGEELARRQTSSLGETLKNEPGVQSTYYGPVTSSPIIRGLDGPRVLITQNGLDAGDASRIGPDHVATGEAASAEQIEVLRGPATLFYGSGAIGGVVNVVDQRVPTTAETYSRVGLSYYTAADQTEAFAAFNTGGESAAFHIDGIWREGDDYDIPGFADSDHAEHAGDDPEHDAEVSGTLPNSALDSKAINLGGSYLFERGHVGISYGRLERLNGVPGHSHGEEAEAEGEVEQAHEQEVQSDLVQDRWQLLSEIALDGDFISAVHTRIGYTDYRHAEIVNEEDHAEEEPFAEPHHEDHGEGTVFTSKTWQARVDLLHEHNAGWHGSLSMEYKRSEFAAVGAEAFTPPSTTSSAAVAMLEERHFGPVLVQLGARVERVTVAADHISAFDYEFTPLSASLGATWDFAPGYKATAVVTHAERAPSAGELFSQGAHLATRNFELGALYRVEPEDGEWHVEPSGAEPDAETSNNLDLSLRKYEGDFGFIVNVFYNQVRDFYYLQELGLSSDQLHTEADHEAEPDGEHAHEHAANLPVYQFQLGDVALYGLEAELIWQFAKPWQATLWFDSIHGEFDSGGELPRLPPTRLGAQLALTHGPLHSHLDVVNYFEQERVAYLETPTDGYTLVDLEVQYSLPALFGELTLFAKGHNLLDEEARVHTSFLKEQAPLPGRAFTLGVRGDF